MLIGFTQPLDKLEFVGMPPRVMRAFARVIIFPSAARPVLSCLCSPVCHCEGGRRSPVAMTGGAPKAPLEARGAGEHSEPEGIYQGQPLRPSVRTGAPPLTQGRLWVHQLLTPHCCATGELAVFAAYIHTAHAAFVVGISDPAKENGFPRPLCIPGMTYFLTR